MLSAFFITDHDPSLIINGAYNPILVSLSEWGIKIPRLYEMGFPHNNCGGRCVAQGKKEWKRLQLYFPERFKEVENWEEKMRNKLGKTKDKSILKNTTLKELAKVGADQMPMFTAEDSYSCFCDY